MVGGILGILASLALPTLKGYIARSRQAEARVNLAHIYQLQETYLDDQGEYFAGDLGGDSTKSSPSADCNNDNDLGFDLTNCSKVRYSYESTATLNTAFSATAGAKYVAPTAGGGCSPPQNGQQGLIVGCETEDLWSINQDRVTVHESDAVKLCSY